MISVILGQKLVTKDYYENAAPSSVIIHCMQ